jgi:hypothetical protein
MLEFDANASRKGRGLLVAYSMPPGQFMFGKRMSPELTDFGASRKQAGIND